MSKSSLKMKRKPRFWRGFAFFMVRNSLLIYFKSKRSAIMTLFQAAMKSLMNFSLASALA